MKKSNNSSGALIIFAKAPIPGQVKTRLCPPLTSDEAASLHGSMVLDSVERSQTANTLDHFLACTPTQEHPFFKIIAARNNLQLWHQHGANLGARMSLAFQTAFNWGYPCALLIGTDIPILSNTVYAQALELLNAHGVVLGPTFDGGYYLIGLKKPLVGLFNDIPWSTDQVLSLTQQKAQSLGEKVALLPRERDLDTIEDLRFFINKTHGPAQPTLSNRTAGVLRALGQRLKGRDD